MNHITIIAAVAENLAIGREGRLIYRLPNDMKRFRTLTTGHTVVMGRRTYESLPNPPLPNRRNIVLSRQLHRLDGCEVYASLDEALAHCQDEELFIIGGESLYRESLPLATRMHLTLIHASPLDADTFFPEYRDGEWTELSRQDNPIDERHEVAYSFVDYEKK